MKLAEVLRILKSLDDEDVDYAIFGAVALNLHGIIRATEDLDLFVRAERQNIERLRQALKAVYDDPAIDEINAEELIDDYPAVRYYPPSPGDGGDFYLDILTRLGDFARFEDLETQEIEIEGVRARVVTPRTLYWLKKGTVRDKDRMDAANIKEKFALSEDFESHHGD